MQLKLHIFAMLDDLVIVTDFRGSSISGSSAAMDELVARIVGEDLSDPERMTALFLISALQSPGELSRLLSDKSDFIESRNAWLRLAPPHQILAVLRYQLNHIARVILMAGFRQIGSQPVDIFHLKKLAFLTSEAVDKNGQLIPANDGDLVLEVDENNNLVESSQYFRVVHVNETDGSLTIESQIPVNGSERLSVFSKQNEPGIYLNADGAYRFQLRKVPILFDVAQEKFAIPEPG